MSNNSHNMARILDALMLGGDWSRKRVVIGAAAPSISFLVSIHLPGPIQSCANQSTGAGPSRPIREVVRFQGDLTHCPPATRCTLQSVGTTALVLEGLVRIELSDSLFLDSSPIATGQIVKSSL